MPDQGPEARMGVAVSSQGKGEFVALHIDLPGSSYVAAFPYQYAEQLRDELPDMLTAALQAAEEDRSVSALVLPHNAGELITPKGN